MSDDQYSDLPMIQFSGTIHLIDTDKALAGLADEMRAVKEFGFDTEARPAFKKGEVYQVALLQLSTDKNAYLVRLNKVNQFQVLKAIFENEEVLKVGVAIRDDIKQLQKRFGFEPRNFVELQDVAKKKGLENFGLKGMTEEVLQARLSKAAKITNWEAFELTDAQVKYAATDAWVGLELYNKLRS
jgi:ribonuclease D